MTARAPAARSSVIRASFRLWRQPAASVVAWDIQRAGDAIDHGLVVAGQDFETEAQLPQAP